MDHMRYRPKTRSYVYVAVLAPILYLGAAQLAHASGTWLSDIILSTTNSAPRVAAAK